jgi:hypothetical protein
MLVKFFLSFIHTFIHSSFLSSFLSFFLSFVNPQVPAIIPGLNDLMRDNEKNEQGEKTTVKRSRGLRGAKQIAKACRYALQCCESGRFGDMEEGCSMPFVFDRCAISRSDKEFWGENSDPVAVLSRAQQRARELSCAPWTPLMQIDTHLSREIEARRIADIEAPKKKATDLSRALLQKA